MIYNSLFLTGEEIYIQSFINKNQKIHYNLDLDESSTWISATPGEMARSTFFYLQEAGHFFCGPNFYTERENLKSYLILFTISGHGRLTYREMEYDLVPGSVFFLKCEEFQRYQTSGNDWESLWIHFDGAVSSDYFFRFFEACGKCVVTLSHPEPLREAMEKIIELSR